MAKEEVKQSQYMLVQVPETFAVRIQTPTEELLTVEQAMVEILNKVDRIAKNVGGQ